MSWADGHGHITVDRLFSEGHSSITVHNLLFAGWHSNNAAKLTLAKYLENVYFYFLTLKFCLLSPFTLVQWHTSPPLPPYTDIQAGWNCDLSIQYMFWAFADRGFLILSMFFMMMSKSDAWRRRKKITRSAWHLKQT